MKLDRNTNRGGRGKYALVNMRKMIPLIIKEEQHERVPLEELETIKAFDLLVERGIITLGNETPGDQFFVMKYKDKFTHHALWSYANAVHLEAARSPMPQRDSLLEFAGEMIKQADAARALGHRIPD